MIRTSVLGRTMEFRSLRATTPDGVSIAIQDHDRGHGGPDILFVHGYCQSSLSWLKQVTSSWTSRCRMVTYDLRGHGFSDKPRDIDHYRDPQRWAEEVQTVIDATGLQRPVIVCWSYGGRVALDFLAHAGTASARGLVMVAATSTDIEGVFGPASPMLRDMALAEELSESILATERFLSICSARPLPADEAAVALAYNMLVPPDVRKAMSGRPAAYEDTLKALGFPVLAIHGAKDQINLPAMSAHTARIAPSVRLKIYQESGHMPFWEEPGHFEQDVEAYLSML